MTTFEIHENTTNPSEDWTVTKGDVDTIIVAFANAFSRRFPDAHITMFAVLDDGSEIRATWHADEDYPTWDSFDWNECARMFELMGLSATGSN